MGFLKHAPILYRERLEKLLHVLRENGGELPWYTMTHGKKFKRWELLAAEWYGWVRIETRRRFGFRCGLHPRVACLEEDTSQARPVPEEWEVPLTITPRHKAFAERTFQYRTIWEAYQATYPKARTHDSVRTRGPRLFRRGSVQAVRAWIIARRHGDIGEDEIMPETVEDIEFRLRGAGWDDARFDQARKWKWKLSEGALAKRRQKSLRRQQASLERRATMPPGFTNPFIDFEIRTVRKRAKAVTVAA